MGEIKELIDALIEEYGRSNAVVNVSQKAGTRSCNQSGARRRGRQSLRKTCKIYLLSNDKNSYFPLFSVEKHIVNAIILWRNGLMDLSQSIETIFNCMESLKWQRRKQRKRWQRRKQLRKRKEQRKNKHLMILKCHKAITVYALMALLFETICIWHSNYIC